MHKFHGRYQRSYTENNEFSTEHRFIIRPEGYILDTRIIYWHNNLFINNGIECIRVGTNKRNSNEKCHPYRRFFTTDCEIFKEKLSSRIICSASILQ